MAMSASARRERNGSRPAQPKPQPHKQSGLLITHPITPHANSHRRLSVHLQPQQTVGLEAMVGLDDLRGFFQP